MNTFTLGVRNAFRNAVRSVSLIAILGLSIGLCLVMLIAYQAVSAKINSVKSSIGNTITITPAGFNSFSSANNALTTDDLSAIKTLPHVTSLSELLTDRLTTIGSASFGDRFGDNNSSNAQTSLASPITLNPSSNSGGRQFRLFINSGGSLPANFSLPTPIVGTDNPATLSGNDVTISSGTMLDGTKDSNNAMVSSAMASKNNLKVGSTFTAYGQTLTVVGIFNTGNQAADSTIVVSLAALQRLTGQSGAVTTASVTADSLDNLTTLTNAIKQKLGSSADVTSTQDQANAAVQPLENVQNISLISLIGAVIAGGVIILLTMVMIVRERRREIGILKAIGASNLRVEAQFVVEALTLTLAGAVVGILIGVAGGNPVTNMLVSSNIASASSSTVSVGPGGPGLGFRARPLSGGFFQRSGNSVANSLSNISANVGWGVIADGLIAALGIAAVGSTLTGWMIVRVKPYEVMRSE